MHPDFPTSESATHRSPRREPHAVSVGVGVIGLGRIGRVHATALARSVDGARLVCVADPIADVAQKVGEQLNSRWLRSAESLLDEHEVEAVVIASPTPTHPKLVRMAAERGKHVLCEKPLALDEREATEAVDAARRAEVILQLGFMLRFDRDFSRLHRAIGNGQLGEIEFFHASLRDMRPPSEAYLRESGGLMADAAIHLFDLATWLVGPVESLSAVGTQMRNGESAGGVDLAVVTLRFTNGALGVVENARAAGYGAECRAEAVGTRGTARIERSRSGHIEWRSPGTLSMDLGSDFVEPFGEAYRAELSAFINSVRGRQPCCVKGEAGVLASRLSRAAAAALETASVVDLDDLAVL